MGNVCGSESNVVEPQEKAAEVAAVTKEESPPEAPPPPRPLTADQPQRALSARPVSRARTPQPSEDSHGICRLLLLGAAEAGKTTLLSQMRVVFKQPFTEAELWHRKVFIYGTILAAIQKLIQMVQKDGLSFSSYENSGHAQNLMLEEAHLSRFTPEMEKAIQSVWKDGVVQDAYARRSQVNLNDSIKYFLDGLERINDIDYVPSTEDFIRSYVPTVGVQNIVFAANNKTFQVFDMGGQRIDRRKWTDMYDGIDVIFFCLAISEYDQVMMEDMKTNRLEDSMNLLAKISTEPKFENSPIFLFLNEIDVFTQKLKHFPLSSFLSDYHGRSAEDAIEYIEEMARDRVNRKDRKMFQVYRTVMTDSKMMSKIIPDLFKRHIK